MQIHGFAVRLTECPGLDADNMCLFIDAVNAKYDESIMSDR